MIKQSNYPINLKVSIDLNTDILLTELSNILKKGRGKLVRLILTDFFNRNINLLDDYLQHKIDKEKLTETILKDFLESNRVEINKFNEFKSKIENE